MFCCCIAGITLICVHPFSTSGINTCHSLQQYLSSTVGYGKTLPVSPSYIVCWDTSVAFLTLARKTTGKLLTIIPIIIHNLTHVNKLACMDEYAGCKSLCSYHNICFRQLHSVFTFGQTQKQVFILKLCLFRKLWEAAVLVLICRTLFCTSLGLHESLQRMN